MALRLHAAILLTEMGPEAEPALPAVVEALGGEDACLRKVAAWVPGHLALAIRRQPRHR